VDEAEEVNDASRAEWGRFVLQVSIHCGMASLRSVDEGMGPHRPFAQGRLDEALGLAIGSGACRAGSDVADVHAARRSRKAWLL
jgi:hypothetical protein